MFNYEIPLPLEIKKDVVPKVVKRKAG